MILLDITTKAWTITTVGWLIVFVALIFLLMLFGLVSNIMTAEKKVKKVDKTTKEVKPGYLSGDESAAIAMALHLFFDEQHDEESNIITIKRIQRRYSPWSSKIYGLRNFHK